MDGKTWLRRTILSGLAVLVPVGLTLYVLNWLFSVADHFLDVLPMSLRPNVSVPGLGLILAFVTTLIVGVATRNFVGKNLVVWFQRAIERIPVVASLYKTFRQIAETFLGDGGGGKGFKGVVLVEWPRNDVWTLAFVTSDTSPALAAPLAERAASAGARLNVFIPTTPNPTSGFYAIVRADQVVPVALSVEEAFKVIISGGALAPN